MSEFNDALIAKAKELSLPIGKKLGTPCFTHPDGIELGEYISGGSHMELLDALESVFPPNLTTSEMYMEMFKNGWIRVVDNDVFEALQSDDVTVNWINHFLTTHTVVYCAIIFVDFLKNPYGKRIWKFQYQDFKETESIRAAAKRMRWERAKRGLSRLRSLIG
jgi:hypothetical protein